MGLALHSFLGNLLGTDLWNVSLAFWKRFLCYETVAALVDGQFVVTGLARDRIVID